jgi:hypothetical protein
MKPTLGITKREIKAKHIADLAVECGCGAKVGHECVDTKPGIVHIGRRIKRLLAGYRTKGEVGKMGSARATG